MSIYQEYVAEVEDRKTQGLHPKPIDSDTLVAEIVTQIKDGVTSIVPIRCIT